jgi:hypothetical protein
VDHNPETYWERAGALGYGEALLASRAAEDHANRRLWGNGFEAQGCDQPAGT